MSKISVIVPVYNVKDYLEECVQSIIKQSYKDLEIILVNDGSTDNSGELCDTLSKLDGRIQVVHKKNGGLSSARNAGLDIATGKYVAFVDSDDYIDLDMYKDLLDACESNNIKISTSGRFKVYETKKVEIFTLSEPQLWGAEEAICRLLKWDGIDSSACDKLFSKSLFNNIRFPLGKINEDVSIMSEIIHNAGGVYHIATPKYYYRYRENSITTNVFNSKKLDLIEANDLICSKILTNYPTLEKEVLSYKLHGYQYLLTIFNRNVKREYRNEYLLFSREIRKNIPFIIFKSNFTKNERLVALLLFTGLFHPIKYLKYLLRRSRS